MKKIFVLFLVVVAPLLACAQTMTAQKVTTDDCYSMLYQFGYECYPFTIPDKYKEATFMVKEVENHKEVDSTFFPYLFDIETTRMTVNFSPKQNDSLRHCGVQWDAGWTFDLKNKFVITDDDYRQEPYMFYKTVGREGNFKIEKGEFIPLVFYGSGYKLTDKKTGEHYYKFCGSFDDLVKLSPHYYLIGIKILK